MPQLLETFQNYISMTLVLQPPQAPKPSNGADREPPYYPPFHEFNPSILSHTRSRSRRLILFSLGLILAYA